ncbi:dna mismatch repair protein msh3 [Diplodia corticola]|uniref:DNA mismatch repair protein MSH3 n=1 Tax=Diplodia corticola TaxID=236234 RepID=A0A1J9QSW8_9PEZI|nr:dna mismatch repair protein msh3 [Diplodia corticola]OJD31082.1 dna mismatch repair protein msh3 [Diplodia corticola]
MAPSSSPFPASQSKKQATISSFFSKKPSSTPKPPARPAEPPKSSPPPAIQPDEARQSSDDDDQEPTAPRRNFSNALKRAQTSDGTRAAPAPKPKRARRTIDDDEDDDDFIPDPAARHPSPDPAAEVRQSLAGVSEADLNGSRSLKGTDRTSRFIFSSSPVRTENQEPDTEETRRAKEKLHQKFVKKLGRPDSIAEIKRRHGAIPDEAGEGEDAEDEDAEDEEPQARPKAKGRGPARKGASKLTPMEKQIIDLKQTHPDTILVVEVGYKFRFFGEDARVAAKELGIVCIPGKMRFDEHPSEAHLDRFAGASFPTHRLHVHVKRLVAAGHKVGVVRQLETAALKKAGDNRNAPFVRKLTNLYTKATYIDEVDGLDGAGASANPNSPATGYILCLTETNAKGWSTDEKVHLGIVAVQPATGDIVYDDFEDGFMRSEIETRLLHIAPCEFLIIGHVSRATEKIVQHLSGSKRNVFGDQARVERVEKPKTMAAQAYSHISSFYADSVKSRDGDPDSAAAVLDKVHQLSEHVTICLSALITHMTEYGLEHVFDLTKNFQAFSARSHMLLNGNTLGSLEIYQNQTDRTVKGSLFWTLDRTKTRFGQRLLRKWVGRPLLNKAKLEERVGAVEELRNGENIVAMEQLKNLLCHVRTDLEKSLIRIYYQKCTRPELLAVLQALQRIAGEYAHVQSPEKSGFSSPIVQEAIANLPLIGQDVVSFLERLNLQAAKEDDKYGFFREEHETEDITDHKVGIVSVEHDLKEHKKEIAETLKKSKVEYVTKAGIEFLIEVNNSEVKKVPASWAKISGTKQVSRFHTPEVVRLLRAREQHKEALAAACDAAFKDLLAEIGTKYQSFRDCVQSLATLDCLLSLAEISNQPGYVKPEYTEDVRVDVSEGRHPMVEQLLLDSYVPNDISLSTDATRALLITGPNMGGKSSFVRQVALICIMAQIGSYVPAASAKLGMLDAVFTRMGAFDNMMAGESTFMVELSETADILKQASPRSLVILDELGRGTSTHDGVAIAQAVLDYMVRDIKALTLFITHYQNLAKLVDGFDQGELKNVHMKFEESKEADGKWEEIAFLYEVGEGVAHRSYGLNVARLADVPEAVLEVAAAKSRELEETMRKRRVVGLTGTVSKMLEEAGDVEIDAIVNGIEQL